MSSQRPLSPRPLSPHVSIYSWQITSVLSIFHRLTGVALTVGTLVLAWWLIALAMGDGAFQIASGFIGSWFGILLMAGWAFAFFYHLCNGIRHLLWDVGIGYELSTANWSGWYVLFAAVFLTVGSFYIVFAG